MRGAISNGGPYRDPYSGADPASQAIVFYEDTGAVVHTFDGIGGGGHYDTSSDGKLAYFKLPGGPRGQRTPFEIHVVNLDGKDDRVLYSLPGTQARFQNLHLSWPRNVNDWFIASYFPLGSSPRAAQDAPTKTAAPARAPLLDYQCQHCGRVFNLFASLSRSLWHVAFEIG